MAGVAAVDAPSWLTVGEGEPLVVLPGLSRHPKQSAAPYTPLARVTGRRIYVLNRPTGMPRGISMTEIAERQVEMLRSTFREPVDMMGVSTGGVIALQIAVDHPGIVRRLVIATAASWLGDEGRRKLRAYGNEIGAGRSGAGVLASVLAPPGRRWMMQPLLWLASRSEKGINANDMLATIDAEVAFDVTPQLSKIEAPTLLIAGGNDCAFPLALVERTAAGIRNSTLRVYDRAGHIGTMLDRRFGTDVANFLADKEVADAI